MRDGPTNAFVEVANVSFMEKSPKGVNLHLTAESRGAAFSLMGRRGASGSVRCFAGHVQGGAAGCGLEQMVVVTGANVRPRLIALEGRRLLIAVVYLGAT